MLFTGNYGFFEYKYNIPGYTGQDYGGFAQYLYLAISAVLLVAALILLRKTPRQRVSRIIGCIGIFLTVFYLIKINWESYWDIRQSGGFNTGILPFDTCSIIMHACLIAGFGKGKFKKLAECWLATGGVVGGFGTMLFLNAFSYYPFLSFGALYSMLWHLLMVFSGLLILVTRSAEIKWTIPVYGFVFHVLFSILVIPLDFQFGWDFMMYRELSSIPLFSDLGSKLLTEGKGALNTLIMLGLYLVSFFIIFGIAAGAKKLTDLSGRRKAG